MPKIKSRRQLRALAERQKNLQDREREQAALQREALRLRTLTAGFSKSSEGGKRSSLLNPTPYRRQTERPPSLTLIDTSIKAQPIELSPEMQERERRAQAEIKQKQKRVAVLYNKGAYQYISDEMDPKTFGRKWSG